jgi:hypothetical protein
LGPVRIGSDLENVMTSPDKSRHEANVPLGGAESLRRLGGRQSGS